MELLKESDTSSWHGMMTTVVAGGNGTLSRGKFRSLAPDRHVLMRLAPGTPKMEEGREYPLAWTRTQGKGRVFYTALGHRPEVWKDERFIGHLLAGIRWAAGEE